MQTGTVNFSARTQGIEIDGFTVESPHANIQSIRCSIVADGHVEINAILNDVYYEDWPLHGVIQEIQQFIDVLSFEFDCPINRFRQSGYSLKTNDGSGKTCLVAEFVEIWNSIPDTVRPSAHSLNILSQRYVATRCSSYVRLYASAIQQDDPIARFMFLYNIILLLSGDRQTEADNNILSIVPTTPFTQSPYKPNNQETVYTRLRNEIAHNRAGADFVATSTEINEWVEGLGNILKHLILKNGY